MWRCQHRQPHGQPHSQRDLLWHNRGCFPTSSHLVNQRYSGDHISTPDAWTRLFQFRKKNFLRTPSPRNFYQFIFSFADISLASFLVHFGAFLYIYCNSFDLRRGLACFFLHLYLSPVVHCFAFSSFFLSLYFFSAILLSLPPHNRKQFFVPALEKIQRRFSIPPNIAGCSTHPCLPWFITLMAFNT